MINKLAIIGCGNMGAALLEGLLNAAVCSKEQVVICENKKEKLQELTTRWGVQGVDSLQEAIVGVDVFILAVKPQAVLGVLEILRKNASSKHKPIVISVAAGVSTSSMEAVLGGSCAVVRAMPNLAVAVGAGVFAVFSNDTSAITLTTSLLSPLGRVVQVGSDKEINIATALAGSGPAFLYHALHALSTEAIQLGMSADAAEILAEEMLFGSGVYLRSMEATSETLVQKITSPQGTTMAGLQELKKADIQDAFKLALRAATARAEQMQQENERK